MLRKSQGPPKLMAKKWKNQIIGSEFHILAQLGLAMVPC